MSMASVRTRDSFDHWWDPEGRKNIIVNRRSLRESTNRYLFKVPLIEGVPQDYESKFPQAALLAEAYVTLVKGEIAQHNGNKEDALWTGMMFGPLFSQIWQNACSISLQAINVPADIAAFRGASDSEQVSNARWIAEKARSFPTYVIEDWLAQETVETAEVFAKAYVKAFAEFATVCERADEPVMVVRHHSAILAEIINDMLNLVVQGGEPTDLRLPDSHLHKQIAMRQAQLRSPAAATLKNICLG